MESIDTYLGHNLEVIAYFIQCLTKVHPIVCCIHLNKPQKCLLNGPYPGKVFFNPVPSNSKIGVGVAGLPHITHETDFTNTGALTSEDIGH